MIEILKRIWGGVEYLRPYPPKKLDPLIRKELQRPINSYPLKNESDRWI